MELNLKPLKGEAFKVTIDPESKVSDLKVKIAEMKAEYPSPTQKLIYSGKILADDQVIKSLEIKPDGFIVVMVTKAAPAPAAAPAAAPAPAAASPAPAPAQGHMGNVAAGGAPAPAEAGGMGGMGGLDGIPGGQEAAARALAMLAAPPPQLPQVVMDMKQSPRFKELTMVIMRGPQVLQQMLPALRAKWPQLLTAITENMEGFMSWMEYEAMHAAMAAAVSQGNPNIPPELAQAIQQNPQALAALLQRAGAGGGDGGGAPGGAPGTPPAMGGAPGAGGAAAGGPPPGSAAVTPEDEAAIGRLAAMGFDRNMCLQAYFACEKNEELAVNFLLSNIGDDMES